MEQLRAFRLAPEAVVARAVFVPPHGWSIVVVTRRGDETWQEAQRETYDRLNTPEMVDALDCTLRTMLGL